eukprot:296869-Rhodomonas_salina.1
MAHGSAAPVASAAATTMLSTKFVRATDARSSRRRACATFRCSLRRMSMQSSSALLPQDIVSLGPPPLNLELTFPFPFFFAHSSFASGRILPLEGASTGLIPISLCACYAIAGTEIVYPSLRAQFNACIICPSPGRSLKRYTPKSNPRNHLAVHAVPVRWSFGVDVAV